MHRATEQRDAPEYSRSPLRSYPFWSPRFWHGMGFGTWMGLLLHNRFAVSPTRWPIAAAITGASVLNSFASVFDRLVLGHRIRRTKLAEPPLLVLGHWRSGTTLLHELLILDPRHTYPNTYQCFEPLHFLWTEWFVAAMANWLLPATRPMDDMQAGFDRPQEDEFALCNVGIPSPYLAWAFPNHGPVADEYLDLTTLPEAERERWKRAWLDFIQRVALAGSRESFSAARSESSQTVLVEKDSRPLRPRRIVLKSPTHTARLRTILEVFPDARFVHMVRDPLVLFPSTVRLWKSLSEVQGMQVMDDGASWIERHVLDTFVQMYERFEKDRELVPPGRLIDVHYEDLVADPVGQMRRVYEELGLGAFEQVESAIRDFRRKKRNYRTNQYDLPPEVAERVRRRWAPYFERYGYRGPEVESASA